MKSDRKRRNIDATSTVRERSDYAQLHDACATRIRSRLTIRRRRELFGRFETVVGSVVGLRTARWSASHWVPGVDRGGCIYVGYRSDNLTRGRDNGVYPFVTLLVAFAKRPARYPFGCLRHLSESLLRSYLFLFHGTFRREDSAIDDSGGRWIAARSAPRHFLTLDIGKLRRERSESPAIVSIPPFCVRRRASPLFFSFFPRDTETARRWRDIRTRESYANAGI